MLKNRYWKIFALIFILAAHPFISLAGQYKCTRVYDGDTIKVTGSGGEITIRLVGIDAPETSKKKHEPGQPFSRKSTKHLAGMVLNKSVTVKSYGTDRYNRTLGVVFVDGMNVNLEMVKMGLAEVYRGRPANGLDLDTYRNAETEARRAKRNMWSLGDKYVSPRDWRRNQRQ
jgi:endonuclease YncB( thermonuclease family)